MNYFSVTLLPVRGTARSGGGYANGSSLPIHYVKSVNRTGG